jgi:U3 small nucleolar RNA-associated protein 22
MYLFLQAEEFRKFWGSKSELRRFQDGGICEAVLWLEKSSIAKKQLVCEQIVKYVLERSVVLFFLKFQF